MIGVDKKNTKAVPSNLLTEYLTFLQDHQCLGRSTINARRNYVAMFLTVLKKRATPDNIRGLTAGTIHDYIIKITKSSSRSNSKQLVTSIRSFLRFLHFRGYSNYDLVPAVPTITTPKLASLPRAIPWNWVKKLLAAPDKRTRRGRRNYAILQLLVTYGVRIGQALSLRISDIKWKEGLINFHSNKGGKSLCLPLQKDVTEALLNYIRKDRRNAPFQQLFLTVKGRQQKPLSCNINLTALNQRLGDGTRFAIPLQHGLWNKKCLLKPFPIYWDIVVLIPLLFTPRWI